MDNSWENSDFISFMSIDDNGTTDDYADSLFDSGRERLKQFGRRVIAASPALVALAGSLKTNEVMKLVFTPETTQMLKDGIYKLQQTKAGDLKAVAVDAGGKIRELGKVSIEEVSQGVNPQMMMMAMQGMAMQSQLEDIQATLKDITQTLNMVLNGQHSDRMAQYFSAESLYREAEMIGNAELRHDLMVESMETLSEAIAKLSLEMKMDIKYIESQYDKGRNVFSNSKKVKEVIQRINESYDIIHSAYRLKASIYYEKCEYSAVAGVLREYKQLLLATIANPQVYEALYYADDSQKDRRGKWFYRSRELPAKIDKVLLQAKSPENYYIEYKIGGIFR